MEALRRAASDLALAVTFLTILPLPARAAHGSLGVVGGPRSGAAFFPLVGALVGALAGGVLVLAEPALGPLLAATLAVTVLVVVTGALHQDGLADCADGLGARGGTANRLAVMRDSAVGVFGVLALLAWGLLLVGALAGLDSTSALHALITAAATGRWSALLHGAVAPPARSDGLGAAFAVSRSAFAVATVIAAAVALLTNPPLQGLATLAAGAVVATVVSLWARRSLGGRTGDTLGATVALTETVVCLTLLALAGP